MFLQENYHSFLLFARQLKCCGVFGPSDWKNSTWYKTSDKSEPYPESCCKNKATKCSVSAKSEDIYQEVSMTTILSSVADHGEIAPRETACMVYSPTKQ